MRLTCQGIDFSAASYLVFTCCNVVVWAVLVL